MIAHAKANPGKVHMASGGVGTAQHVYGELFKSMTGVDMLHVPYRGGGPALIDVLSGQMEIMFETFGTGIGHVQAGKLRALAVTSPNASLSCPMCRRSPRRCRITKRGVGRASARPNPRHSTSWTS